MTSTSKPLVVRVARLPGAQSVAMRLWLRGGSRVETRPGTSWVTGRCLLEGTRSRDWREIAEASEDRGMMLGGFGSLEVEGVRVDCLLDDWALGLDWLTEIALESTFPEERCAWVCRQGAAELESLADQPEVLAGWAFSELLYGDQAPGRPLQGSAASLAALTAAECEAHHRRALSRGGVLSVVGDIDADEIRSRTSRLAARVGGGDAEEVPLAELGSALRSEVTTESPDQAHLYLGHPTVPIAHPDARDLEILSIVLGAGAGLSGRIPERVREREGLAYSTWVATTAGAGIEPGRFIVYVGTSAGTADRAERCVREEIDRLLDRGPEPLEVRDAVSYLRGREPFRRETTRQRADLMAQAGLHGLPLDEPGWMEERLAAATPASLLETARRHLRPEEIRVAVGAPGG